MTLQPMLAANTDRWLWWDWVGRNTDLIRHALWVHIELTVISVALGLAISLPLAVWSQRHRRLLGPCCTRSRRWPPSPC